MRARIQLVIAALPLQAAHMAKPAVGQGHAEDAVALRRPGQVNRASQILADNEGAHRPAGGSELQDRALVLHADQTGGDSSQPAAVATGWCCVRCGHPHDSKVGRTLTIHHLDLNPGNNARWNLLAL
jgi:hypothetical protein